MLIINPGSGPVAEATFENASTAMNQFAADLRERGHKVSASTLVSESDRDGRWQFALVVDDVKRDIRMPGVPVENVRYLGAGQNPWDFPRLYVDGSSWLWCFALDVCKREADTE